MRKRIFLPTPAVLAVVTVGLLAAFCASTLALWAIQTPRNHGAIWFTRHGDPQHSGFCSQFQDHPPCPALELLAAQAHFSIDTAPDHNIVSGSVVNFSANPEKLTEKEVSEFIFNTPVFCSKLQKPDMGKCAFALGADTGWLWKKL